MTSFRTCFFTLLSFATRSLQQSKDTLADFCRRWGHQTAQVDGKLYIDGGLVAWNPLSANPLNYTSTFTTRLTIPASLIMNRYMAPLQWLEHLRPGTNANSICESIQKVRGTKCIGWDSLGWRGEQVFLPLWRRIPGQPHRLYLLGLRYYPQSVERDEV